MGIPRQKKILFQHEKVFFHNHWIVLFDSDFPVNWEAKNTVIPFPIVQIIVGWNQQTKSLMWF